ncbi:MAG: CPBP family intramembrane glutamic endopeptidase [Hyphomicrobiaceae bacterium]|nr:CPBP family intramembrane glutamic endopeptidase [Hyphomicrobiaceae bacterium]
MTTVDTSNRLIVTEAGLAAGGTLPRPDAIAHPSLARRTWLTIEMLVLFIGLPLALLYVVETGNVPLFVVLPPVLVVFVIVLLADRSFLLRRELIRLPSAYETMSIFAVFAVAGLMVAAYVAQEMPGQFLSFPRQRPETWQRVMILYPLLSVPVQELVYRTFFFHRYGPLFGERRGLLVVTNGLLFGLAHIVFGNWIAIIGTAIIGMLLAYRYEATRSFWAVWLEHALWGGLVFTVGLGRYFFTGRDNLPAWESLREGLDTLQRLPAL